jgi:hypothetical protein
MPDQVFDRKVLAQFGVLFIGVQIEVKAKEHIIVPVLLFHEIILPVSFWYADPA